MSNLTSNLAGRAGGGPPLSDNIPVKSDNATGSAGVSTEASRSDHKHPEQEVFTDPNNYEYGIIQPFTSNIVPETNGNYQFNSFSDNQLRTIQGITVNVNSFTLAQGGMFKLEASIKPNTNANGASDYAFHDGTSYIGKIGTIAVDGSSKAIDVGAVAFVNTVSGAKTITLKNIAGSAGIEYDTNGTAITIQRVAG